MLENVGTAQCTAPKIRRSRPTRLIVRAAPEATPYRVPAISMNLSGHVVFKGQVHTVHSMAEAMAL